MVPLIPGKWKLFYCDGHVRMMQIQKIQNSFAKNIKRKPTWKSFFCICCLHKDRCAKNSSLLSWWQPTTQLKMPKTQKSSAQWSHSTSYRGPNARHLWSCAVDWNSKWMSFNRKLEDLQIRMTNLTEQTLHYKKFYFLLSHVTCKLQWCSSQLQKVFATNKLFPC